MPTYRTIISYRGAEQVSAHFLIADSLANLSAASPVDVGVFFPGDLSQDMDVDAGTFAADELELVVDGVAADTADDTAAIAFAIDAAESLNDPTKKRFVGVLINPATPPAVGDWAFRGVLLPEITADDVNWNDGEFGVAPAPLRTYKLRAMSADVMDILDAKLTDIVDEIKSEASWKTANVQDRLGWFYSDGSSDEFGHREGRYGDLVAWSVLIQRLLDLASAPYGVTITYESELCDFLALPAHFDSGGKFGRNMRYSVVPSPPPLGGSYSLISYQLQGYYQLNPGGGVTTAGALFVDWKLLDPDSENQSVSWLRYETVGNMLYAVALSLGMVVEWKYLSGTDIRLRFLSRSNIQTKPTVLFPDAEKGTISSRSNSSTGKKFSARSWSLCREGFNAPYFYDGSFYESPDQSPIGIGVPAPVSQRQEPTNDHLLPLSFSPTVCVLKEIGEDADLEADDFIPPWLAIPHNGVFWDGSSRKSSNVEYNRAVLHTGMYMGFIVGLHILESVSYGCNTRWVVRPIGRIEHKVDGQKKGYWKLADYCNAIYKRDAVYYETQYELDVPYITRFRSTPAGAEHWANVGLGFTATLDGVEYTVVGITRNFRDGATKIRLQSRDRFSGISVEGIDTVEDETPVYQISAAPPPYDRRGRTTVMLKAGEDMTDDWTVVALRDDDLLYIAEPIEQEYERTVGVVIGARQAGDTCEVQLRGRVKLPVELSAAVGSRVYLRSESLMDTNISIHPLKQRTATEQLHLNLGYLESPNTLFLEMSEEWVLQ